MKKMWITFLVSFILLTLLRLLQMFTGFLPEAIYPSVLLGAALFLIVLQIATTALTKKDSFSFSPVKSIPCTIFGIGVSVAVIFRSVYDIYNLTVLKEFNTHTFVDKSPVFYAVLSILGLICATIFLVIGLSNASGTNALQRLPLLGLLIPIWYCYSLVIEFVTAISRRNSVENSIEVLAMVFILLFLFFQAKLLAGVETEVACKRCFLYGLPAVICSFGSSFLYFIAYFNEIEFNSTISGRLHAINLLFAAYILFFLIALSRRRPAAAPAPALHPQAVKPVTKEFVKAETNPSEIKISPIASTPQEQPSVSTLETQTEDAPVSGPTPAEVIYPDKPVPKKENITSQKQDDLMRKIDEIYESLRKKE